MISKIFSDDEKVMHRNKWTFKYKNMSFRLNLTERFSEIMRTWDGVSEVKEDKKEEENPYDI